MNGIVHDSDKSYTVHFSFWKNKLILHQYSKTHGDWEAQISIFTWSPTAGMGNFSYSKNTPNQDEWGIMQVWLNLKEKIITIESSSRNSEGKGLAKYLLKKQTTNKT